VDNSDIAMRKDNHWNWSVKCYFH